MGKIRVKTIGADLGEIEEKKSREAGSFSAGHKEKREAKKMSSRSEVSLRKTKAPGLKGGQRVVAVGPSQEELAHISASEVLSDSAVAIKISDRKTATTEAQKKKRAQKQERVRSKRYQTTVQMLDKTKVYPMTEALELLAKFQKAKFDETVELHLNTARTGITANFTLPHGTGKKIRVVVADDKLIEEIEKNKIDFDILLAQPTMMPKLARVAKILGPKGLMPNPKNGTITPNPQDLIKKYEAGQVSFKTEAKAPLIHLTVGKFSFGEKKLMENIDAILQAVKQENIQKIVLKSTMSPAIKVRI